MAAVRHGQCIDTSMAFTPTAGLPMSFNGTAGVWNRVAACKGAMTPGVVEHYRIPRSTLCAIHADNRCARGAYEIAPSEGAAKVTFFATGSEVELAMAARALLKADGIGARVVSMPCWSLFEQQDATYRDAVLGKGTLRVGIEAGVREGWDRYIGDGPFIGMKSFGASAPYKDVYKHFGITAEAAADAAKKALKG